MHNPTLAVGVTGEEFQVLLVLCDRYNRAFTKYFSFWENSSRLSN
ncbi:MAG TPA: hypothetical protein V6D35_19440 [Candidatus Sericytochromatia bacterium]